MSSQEKYSSPPSTLDVFTISTTSTNEREIVICDLLDWKPLSRFCLANIVYTDTGSATKLIFYIRKGHRYSVEPFEYEFVRQMSIEEALTSTHEEVRRAGLKKLREVENE